MCAPSDAWLLREGTKVRILWQNECLARLSCWKTDSLMRKEEYDPISHQSSGGLLSLDRTSWFDQGLISLNKGARKRASERQILNMHSSCRSSIRQVQGGYENLGSAYPIYFLHEIGTNCQLISKLYPWMDILSYILIAEPCLALV